MASTWCEQSLDIVSGFYFEKWARTITSHQWMAGCQQSFACTTAWSRHFLSIEKATVRLKYYRLFIVKTTWGLIIKKVWHVSTNFTDTIWNFRLPIMTCTSHYIHWQVVWFFTRTCIGKTDRPLWGSLLHWPGAGGCPQNDRDSQYGPTLWRVLC